MATPNATKFCDQLKFNRFHLSLLVLGIVTLVFDGYDSQIISYVMPHVMKEWHLTPVAAGSVASYGLIGLMVGTAAMGMLADRIGRKPPLILGLVIFSVFSGWLYWVHDFRIFCILRFLAGIGMGGAFGLSITLASEFSPSRIRAWMVATIVTGFQLGPAIAAVVSMLLIPSYGWRIVLLFAFLPLIFIPFLCYFLPESVRFLARKGRYDQAVGVLRRMERAARVSPATWTKESFSAPHIERKVSVSQLFSSKLALMTILVWLVYFFNLLAIYLLITWLSTLLFKAGFTLVRSYGYTAMGHLGGILGGIFLGMVLDRVGSKWGLISAYVLAGVVSWLFGQATGSPAALYLLSFANGFFLLGGMSAQQSVTGAIYPTSMRATGVGWTLTMGRFGAACGPVVGGFLQSAGLSFSQYFAFLAIPSLLCAASVLFYRMNVKGETLEIVEAEMVRT